MKSTSAQQYVYNSGYLKVSGGHKLYFEQYGNPAGTPFIYLHGGPGSGFSPSARRFFNPHKCNVLFFDQRGAGKSKPFGMLKNNRTQDLVDDINALIDYAGFKKAAIFGGSWGSTLALVYAIRNPQKVSGLIVRGIFLANKNDLDLFANGRIVAQMFPDVWERLLSFVPAANRHKPMKYYFSKILRGTPAESKLYSREWARYEYSTSSLKYDAEEVDGMLTDDPKSAYTMALLEGHYLLNNCFISEDYIVKNTKKLAGIPLSIIHGRYDMVCPLLNAFRLHQALPDSKLIIPLAGHSSSDKEMNAALIREVNAMQRKIRD